LLCGPGPRSGNARNRKRGIPIQAAFGVILSDGSVYTGSGNFTITKSGTGSYYIEIPGTTNPPALTVTPVSAYINANVVIDADYPGGSTKFHIKTGYSDHSKDEDMDFSFIALWT